MISILILYLLSFLIRNVSTNSPYYDPDECGKNHVSGSNVQKVMGGADVKYGEYTEIVSIFKNDNFHCTGFLVSRRHVITAAHCFFDKQKETTIIKQQCAEDVTCRQKLLLDPNLKEKCPNPPIPKKKILQIYDIYHDPAGCKHGFHCERKSTENKYKPVDINMNYLLFFLRGCHLNDYVILKLDRDIDLNLASYACLPNFNHHLIRGEPTVTFLGYGSDPARTHAVLQKADFGEILTKSQCLNFYSRISDDQLCVREYQKKNQCHGDSGGPLIAEYHGREYAIAALSLGTSCEKLYYENAHPKAGMFTRLDFYLNVLAKELEWKNSNFDDLTDIIFE